MERPIMQDVAGQERKEILSIYRKICKLGKSESKELNELLAIGKTIAFDPPCPGATYNETVYIIFGYYYDFDPIFIWKRNNGTKDIYFAMVDYEKKEIF